MGFSKLRSYGGISSWNEGTENDFLKPVSEARDSWPGALLGILGFDPENSGSCWQISSRGTPGAADAFEKISLAAS